MIFKIIVLLALTTTISSTFQTLFPEQNRLYSYSLVTNVTAGTLAPIEDGSYWILEGRLNVQVYDGYGRARFQLEGLKTSIHTKHSTTPVQTPDAIHQLRRPFEVGICFSAIHVDEEARWVTNIKRAVALNFLVAEPRGSLSSVEEPCLYGNCLSMYSRVGGRLRKYIAASARRTRPTAYEQQCAPPRPPQWARGVSREDPNYLITAERDYYLDETYGLRRLELKSDFQYRTHGHILGVVTEMTLNYEGSKPVQSTQKLNLTEFSIQYDYTNTTDIWSNTQDGLRNKTYGILLKIARKGIDADNIVRNASLIHSLDFVDLLSSMSELSFESLAQLFNDVLGTSYELETSRNIFLEVLPYVRSSAAARLIRYLIIEQKAKIEDAMLISLIRKLPYNIVDYSRTLLEELEVFTKLGPDFSQDIRHAGILSFATMVSKSMEISFDQQFFDDIYDKYLRMYNYCPQYVDRLVWLQGLANVGKTGVNYLDEIYTDTKKDRHERLWAELASLSIWKGANLENTLPILMNETEHIQLRVLALHAILSSPLGARDFFNVHNYIKNTDNNQLKRFWYTTMKSLENNRFYDRYKSASYYTPFLSNFPNPGHSQWATSNYIVSQEPTLDVQGPTLQLLTVGGQWSGPPELVLLEFSTGGGLDYNGAVYIIAEGVTWNLFSRFQNFTSSDMTDRLLKMLNEIKIESKDPEKVHIDIVIKVYDKTVYTTHIDQKKFDSWNAKELEKSIKDFVRFGSHINQQMVYYPSQMVKTFPTEVGTPVRLQSTIVSFTSIRGNLTAPAAADLTWLNDLHVRYQGTAVTSISTAGPLHPSEHIARIQQSMVVHLPTKFDVKLAPSTRTLELKWTNPSQNGGIAMHSRTQVQTISRDIKEVHTVSSKNKMLNKFNKDNEIFFDCENPMSGSEISHHLTSKHYNILTSLQPSLLILNTIRLITSPTAGSCGLILPPRQLQTGNNLDLVIRVEEMEWDGRESRGGRLRVVFEVDYYRIPGPETKDKHFSLTGSTELVSTADSAHFKGALSIGANKSGGPTNFSICIENQHKDRSPFNVDFTTEPASYKGRFTLNFTTGSACDDETGSSLMVDYENQPFGRFGRTFKIQSESRRLPELRLGDLHILESSDLLRLFNLFANSGDKSNNVIIQEQHNNIQSVTVNGEEVYPSSVLRLPPSATALQMLKHLGFYHECRVNAKTEIFEQQLIIGDCTEKPRFAIIQPAAKGSIVIFAAGDAVTYKSPNGFVANTGTNDSQLENFKILTAEGEYILQSKLTGVLVYHKPNIETVILVPQPYMYAACGSCLDN